MNELMKLFFMILAGLITVSSVHAEGIDRNEALKKAQSFLPDRCFTISKRFLPARDKGVNTGETDAFYVFNAANNQGFVIVSGDRRTRDIIGYSEHGNLDVDSLPENIRWWLESYVSQLSALSTTSTSSGNHIEGAAIEPLVKAKWAQDWPFNLRCPDGNYVDYDESGYDNYRRCVTGCVATAVTQVLYYWKWPKTCPAVDGYTVEGKKPLKALPETTFKWDAMADNYSETSADEATDAVAELMRYCGQALKLRYGTGVTSGYTNPSVLINTFGYSKNMRELKRDDYTTNQWESAVYQELAAKRPVLYSGASNTSGHAFIIDGYDGHGLFHINWGWRGVPDSYFVLSLADPGLEQGIGGSGGAYHHDQTALFNMRPAEDGEVLRPVMRMSASNYYPSEVNETYTRENAAADFTNVFLSSHILTQYPIEPESELSAEVGWGLYQDDELILLVGSNDATVPANADDIISNIMEVTFGAGLQTGSYQLTQVFRFPGDTDWQRCEGYGVYSLLAEVTPTKLTVRAPDKYNMAFSVNSMSVSDYPEVGGTTTVHANITNTGDTQQLTAVLWMQKQGESTWTKCSDATCYTEMGTSADINMSFIQQEAGDYNLKITIDKSEAALKVITVSFAACEEVVVDGLRYRCSPSYGRATVIRDLEADANMENPIIQQTVTAKGIDCKVVAIGDCAFQNWQMTSITIPEGIEIIGNDAFRYCSKLTKILLPSTVNHIGSYAFYGMLKLSQVVSHIQNPPVIGNEVFMYQKGDYVNNAMNIYPSSATLYVPIGKKTVYEVQAGWNIFNVIEEGDLKEAVVDGIRYEYSTGETKAKVVYDESYLTMTEASIPATVYIEGKTRQVTAIGLSAFDHCWEINKITLPEGLETIGSRAFAGTGVEEIILPGSLKTIGEQAFTGCHVIQSLTVPEGVTTIGQQAFYYMSHLVKLELPKSLSSVGVELIRDCKKLTTVVCHVTNPYPISSRTFISDLSYEGDAWVLSPSKATLYVPQGEVPAYQALTGWNYFAYIKEIEQGTGLVNITDVDSHNAVHYDLTGKVVRSTAKGLHIVRIGNKRAVKVIY